MLFNYGVNRKNEKKRIEHRNGRIDFPHLTEETWGDNLCFIRSVIETINPGWQITGYCPTPKEESVFIKLQDRGHVDLPMGYRLYWEPNGAGGRTYTSDEIPPGVTIMDTCLQKQETLQIAMAIEAMLRSKECSTQKSHSDC